MTQNDVMTIMIGKDVGAVPVTAAGSPIIEASDTYLLDGEMAVVNAHNIVLSAGTVLTDDLVKIQGCKIVQRSGDYLIYSDLIKQNNITGVKSQIDVAVAEQLSYIGYNTTAGSITVTDDTAYVVRFGMREIDRLGHGMKRIKDAVYTSDDSATQEEIVFGLALSMSNSFRGEPHRSILTDVICNTAVTAANCFDDDATVINGSRSFSVLTNLDYNTGAGTAVVGDYVRIGTATGAVGATALGSNMYKITAIAALVITVDRPIESASGTYTAVGAHLEVIPSATGLAANFGIKCTGLVRKWILGKWKYSKVEFEIGLNEPFGNTLKTYTTAMNLGRGTYEQIAELEYELLGNEGMKYRGDYMYTQPRTDALSTALYDVISLTYFDDVLTDGVSGKPSSPKQLIIAFETGFGDNEAPDIVCDVIAAYTTVAISIAV